MGFDVPNPSVTTVAAVVVMIVWVCMAGSCGKSPVSEEFPSRLGDKRKVPGDGGGLVKRAERVGEPDGAACGVCGGGCVVVGEVRLTVCGCG